MDVFAEVLRELGVRRHTLVWAKDAFVFGRSDYRRSARPRHRGFVGTGCGRFRRLTSRPGAEPIAASWAAASFGSTAAVRAPAQAASATRPGGSFYL